MTKTVRIMLIVGVAALGATAAYAAAPAQPQQQTPKGWSWIASAWMAPWSVGIA